MIVIESRRHRRVRGDGRDRLAAANQQDRQSGLKPRWSSGSSGSATCHPCHTWKLLRHRLHYRLLRLARRAIERDERAIARWVAEDWA